MMPPPVLRPLALRLPSRLGAVAVLLGALLPSLAARPALAADSQVTVTITQRWQLQATEGTWTPYVITIRDGGSSPFTGDLYLLPNDSRQTSAAAYPIYRVPVDVGRGGSRSIPVYVIDAPGGYTAELRDSSGRTVMRSSVATSPRSGSAVGILSDLTQAEQKIGAPLHSLSRVDASLARFASPQDFPTNAVYLSGLSTLVVDQFDSAALSQAQVQALKDFVGLGGALIEAGGPSWRRTLLSLPAELLPMRPSSTATAALAPLAELAGQTTEATAQVASGPVGRGARVTLETPDGVPLVVEGTYGSGRLVELAFDPFAEPFDTHVALAGMAWAHAIGQALSGIQGAAKPVGVSGGIGISSSFSASDSALAAAPGGWAPGYSTASQDQLGNVLNDTPAAAAPPVGLLGGMLVAYVLLAGLLNYLFLKALGQRVMMWASVPLVAVVFTAGAYAVGFGSRGTDFVVTEVQVQRLAPDGAAQTYTFDGVYPPRKGDVHLSLPGNTLVSTAISQGDGNARNGAVITAISRPQVLLGNVAVWNMQPVQTLSVSHPYAYEPRGSMPVDVQLNLRKGRLQGAVVNRTSHPISDLELVSASGTELTLAGSLGPGASIPVDLPFSQTLTGAAGGPAGTTAPAVRGLSDSSRDSLIRLAASQASSHPGELAVVGFTKAIDSLSVEGGRPSGASVAAVVEPFQLLAADSLSGLAPRARWVSNYFADDSSQTDVYDFDLPPGLTAPVGLSYDMLQAATQTGVTDVAVYNWDTHSWRSLPKQAIPSRSQAPVALAPGELAQGVVRVRVQESLPGQAQLALGNLPVTGSDQ